MSYLQISNKPIQFGIISVISLCLSLSISLSLIILCDYDYSGRLWANMISSFTIFLYSLFYFFKKKFFSKLPKLTYVKNIILFGLPLVPNALSHLVMNSSDRLFIGNMISMEEAGIYQIGYTLGSIILLVNLLFFRAWSPILYKHLANNSKEDKLKIVRINVLFLLLIVILIFSLSFIISPLVFSYFIDASFRSGRQYVFWVSASYFFWSIFQVFGHVLFFHKKTAIFFYLGVMNIALNLILNYYLILIYSTIGATYATLINLLILGVVTAIYSHSKHPLPWLAGVKSFKKSP